ncbi:putative XkdX family phage protein [Paenibacillus shirakamiensis]|uniref:XkdX family phage protein n=1 Tax=Paenibacillus shirakamiensis TaxID=1265935 RepID=A0ABS4JLH7_9BACL|nr:XkdX family protein [Paenibacillus shirakamiensis]MBP2002558.1 putative XkdX family phage protein [Paenibacillus shirakamiensis]
MNWFKTVKRYFDMGIYTTDETSSLYVGKFVSTGKITAEQYKEITSEDFK